MAEAQLMRLQAELSLPPMQTRLKAAQPTEPSQEGNEGLFAASPPAIQKSR